MVVYYSHGNAGLLGENTALVWDMEGYLPYLVNYLKSCNSVWIVPGTFDPNED